VHPAARAVDHVGPAHDLPVPDEAYDAVLCTQVLEHVPNPDAVIAAATTASPRSRNCCRTWARRWAAIPTARTRNVPRSNRCCTRWPRRSQHSQTSTRAASSRSGYSIVARRPGGDPAPAPVAIAELPGARAFKTLCFAADVLVEPSLLAAYAQDFRGSDDATLVIYAPRTNPDLAEVALSQPVDQLGLDGPDSPDMIALPYPGTAPDEHALAAAIDAVLSLRPPWGAFTGLRWAHPGTLADLRELVPSGSNV
jgi:Methyltransferase domain